MSVQTLEKYLHVYTFLETTSKETRFLQIIKKIGLGPRYIGDLLYVSSLPKDILEKEAMEEPENRIDVLSLASLASIEDGKLLRKVYMYLKEKKPAGPIAQKIITRVKRASEPLRRYILSTKPEDLDLQKIDTIIATFRSVIVSFSLTLELTHFNDSSPGSTTIFFNGKALWTCFFLFKISQFLRD